MRVLSLFGLAKVEPLLVSRKMMPVLAQIRGQ